MLFLFFKLCGDSLLQEAEMPKTAQPLTFATPLQVCASLLIGGFVLLTQ